MKFELRNAGRLRFGSNFAVRPSTIECPLSLPLVRNPPFRSRPGMANQSVSCSAPVALNVVAVCLKRMAWNDRHGFLRFGNRLSDGWTKPSSNRYGGVSCSTASTVTMVEDSIRIGPYGPSSSTIVCWLC